MKPATPLPWNLAGTQGHGTSIWAENEIIFSANNPRSRGVGAQRDSQYLVHAANAYPKLIEALKQMRVCPSDKYADALLRELGEDK